MKSHIKEWNHYYCPRPAKKDKIRRYEDERDAERAACNEYTRQLNANMRSRSAAAPIAKARQVIPQKGNRKYSRWDQPKEAFHGDESRPSQANWRKKWRQPEEKKDHPDTPTPEKAPFGIINQKSDKTPTSTSQVNTFENCPFMPSPFDFDKIIANKDIEKMTATAACHEAVEDNTPKDGEDPGAATATTDSESIPDLVTDTEDTSKPDTPTEALKCWHCSAPARDGITCDPCKDKFNHRRPAKDSPDSPPLSEQGSKVIMEPHVHTPVEGEELQVGFTPPILRRQSWNLETVTHLEKAGLQEPIAVNPGNNNTTSEPDDESDIEHEKDDKNGFYVVSLEKEGFIGDDVVFVGPLEEPLATDPPALPAAAAADVSHPSPAEKSANKSPDSQASAETDYTLETTTFRVPKNLPFRKRMSRRLRDRRAEEHRRNTKQRENYLDLDPKVRIERLQADSTSPTEAEPDVTTTLDENCIIIE